LKGTVLITAAATTTCQFAPHTPLEVVGVVQTTTHYVPTVDKTARSDSQIKWKQWLTRGCGKAGMIHYQPCRQVTTIPQYLYRWCYNRYY